MGAATAAVEQDVAIVFLQSDSGEAYITVDRNVGDRYASSTSFGEKTTRNKIIIITRVVRTGIT